MGQESSQTSLLSFLFLFLSRASLPSERDSLKDFIHRVQEKFSALNTRAEEETLRTSSPLSFRTTTLLLLLLLLEREEEEEKKGRK